MRIWRSNSWRPRRQSVGRSRRQAFDVRLGRAVVVGRACCAAAGCSRLGGASPGPVLVVVAAAKKVAERAEKEEGQGDAQSDDHPHIRTL